MIYSVWKPGERRYDYYSLGGVPIEDDTPAPSLRGGSKIGYAPGEASWTLPANAQKIGEGARARGIVVHPGSGAQRGLGDWTSFEYVGLWAGIALIAYMTFTSLLNERG